MMLDGNAAALRSHEQRESLIDHVFQTYEAIAREQLAEEADVKFPESKVTADQIFDELICDQRLAVTLEISIETDDAVVAMQALKALRKKAAACQRDLYIEKNLEERVWALYNRE